MKTIDALILAIVIILAIAIVIGLEARPSYARISNQTMFIQLTDPPQVPVGTQSLNITYSSLQLHYLSKGNVSKWVSVNSSGTIDLLALVNLTKTIASVQVPNNSSVDMIRFNVTSAAIEINGTTYNVTLPNKQVTATLRPTTINSSSSLLIDFTPSIATIYTMNSTIFVMVPSLRAVVMPSLNTSASHIHVGATQPLNVTMRKHLEMTRPNITITHVILSQSGNKIEVSITVADNSNSSVKINHIMLFGNESVRINASFMHNIGVREKPSIVAVGFGANSMLGGANNGSASFPTPTVTQNTSGLMGGMYHEEGEIGSMLNGTFNVSAFPKMFENVSSEAKERAFINGFFNASVSNISTSNLSEAENEVKNLRNKFWDIRNEVMGNISINASMKAEIEQNINNVINETSLMRIKIEQEHFRVINFLVSPNATLILPYLQEMPDFNGIGYTINPGQSATFTFNGSISYADNHVILSLIPGDTYKVVVIGEEGARATTNTTAS